MVSEVKSTSTIGQYICHPWGNFVFLHLAGYGGYGGGVYPGAGVGGLKPAKTG